MGADRGRRGDGWLGIPKQTTTQIGCIHRGPTAGMPTRQVACPKMTDAQHLPEPNRGCINLRMRDQVREKSLHDKHIQIRLGQREISMVESDALFKNTEQICSPNVTTSRFKIVLGPTGLFDKKLYNGENAIKKACLCHISLWVTII